jgi:hypothetical protein
MAATYDESVTISLASIPDRQEGLVSAVEALLPQCDHMHVCLNGYQFIPKEIYNKEKITITQYMSHEECIGDRGKFLAAADVRGYHFTCDDDIYYPVDYVRRTIAEIERYERQAVVSYHGHLLCTNNGRAVNYPVTRLLMRFGDNLVCDVPSHILGTGVTAYHAQIAPLDFYDFPDEGRSFVVCQ